MNEANQTPPADAPLLLPEGAIEEAMENLKNFQVAPKFIFRRENYYDQDGLRIEENILISGAFPPDFPRWVAHAVCSAPLPAKPGAEPQIHRQAIFVAVPGETIQEVYTNAPALLKGEADRFEKHWKEQVLGNIAQNVIRKKLLEGVRPQ